LRDRWQVTGVDFAIKAIQKARQKAKLAGVRVDFQVDDVTHLPNVEGPFDLVLDIGCFHTLSEQGKINYAHNLPRLLKPEGTLLLYASFREPNRSGSGLTDDDLLLLENYLELVSRQDGTERGRRPSAWFTYRLKTKP